jgi:biopolymer transport protein ExbD
MGAGPMPEQGGGGKKKKKALDASVNVVPAIDLFAVLTSFLLLTAVWTQISRLQVQQLGTGAPEPPTVEQQKSLTVTLAMGERGFNLSTSGGMSLDIPLSGRSSDGKIQFDLKLLSQSLKRVRSDAPDTAAITVSVEDPVEYGDLVHVIDLCVEAGLQAVSVTGV